MAKSTVAVRFTGDVASLKGALDSVESHVKGVGSKLASFGKVAAIGMGALAAGAAVVGKGLYDAAIESQKVTKQTEAVIKSMGGAAKVSADQVADLATKLSLKSGADDEMIQSGANVMLTFGKIRNEVGKGNAIFDRATNSALDMSVALGTDMKSASILVGKALNDPIKGLTALGRSGIQFTESQKKTIKSLVDSGKTLEAQKIILGELDKQFGGSAAAQATAGDRLKVAWGNLQEQLGDKLIPVFEAVARWASALLPKAFSVIERVVDEVSGGFRAFVAAFKAGDGDITSAGFPGFMERAAAVLRTAFDSLAAWWRDNGPKITAAAGVVIGAIVDWFKEAEPPIRDWVENVLGSISKWWDENSDTIIGLVEGVASAIKTALEDLITAGQFVIQHWDQFKIAAEAMAVFVIGHYVRLAVAATTSAATQVAAWVSTKAAAALSQIETAAIVALMVADWVALAAKAVFNAGVIVAAWVSTQLAALRSEAVMVGAATAQGGAWAGLATAAETSGARIAKAWLAALGPAAAVIAAAETINNLTGNKMNPNKLSLLERLDPRKAFHGLDFHIPGFDEGGVVPGSKGSPQLILAHGGETVLPTHKDTRAGTAVNIENISLQATSLGDLIAGLEYYFQARGM